MNNCLITGASSGIGKSLAFQYAKSCKKLILIARRKDKLIEIKQELESKYSNLEVIVESFDLTNLELITNLSETLSQKHIYIDTLIANAGMGVTGYLNNLEISDFKRQFELNVDSVIHLVLSFKDHLIKTKGSIALVSSILGYFTIKKNTPYCMSKFAVRSFAQGLQIEFKKFNVSTTLICPGLIESEFRLRDNFGNLDPSRKDYLPSFITMKSDRAAKIIYKAVNKRKNKSIITFHGKVLVLLNQFCPSILRFILNKVGY